MTTGATQAQTNANCLVERHPLLCPTDGDAIIPKPKEKEERADMQDGKARKVDKKSPEYLLKSLIAGGIAGCAVCTPLLYQRTFIFGGQR
jgi:solute carrier family 25 protein 16